MKNKLKNYQDNWKRFLILNLRTVDYLRTASEDILEELYCDLKEEVYEEGTTICNLNDPISKILFIADGKVEISVKYGHIDIPIETLYQGWSMGEYGILDNCKFMFTAKAKSTFVKAYTISKDIISAIIFMTPEIRQEVESLKKPLKIVSDVFLDFRIIRTEGKKVKIK